MQAILPQFTSEAVLNQAWNQPPECRHGIREAVQQLQDSIDLDAREQFQDLYLYERRVARVRRNSRMED